MPLSSCMRNLTPSFGPVPCVARKIGRDRLQGVHGIGISTAAARNVKLFLASQHTCRLTIHLASSPDVLDLLAPSLAAV